MDVHALLWERPAAPKRGPRPTLTLEAVARAAIEVADVDGLAAVTMQRVADVLGVTKMALYRYVPGKDELVVLMTDIGLGAPPQLDDVTGGWRPKLDEWARRMFLRFREHPWSLDVTIGERVVGPNEVGWLEQAVAALTGTGLDGGEMLDVAATLVGHVRTIAQQTATTHGTTETSLAAAFAAVIRGREDRFPALLAALDSAVAHDSRNNALDFGLARILDGVALLIDRRAKG